MPLEIAAVAGGSQARPESGAIAQLGERLNGIQEVVGSIPIGSTKQSFAKLTVFQAGE